jgi:hypothetical protein
MSYNISFMTENHINLSEQLEKRFFELNLAHLGEISWRTVEEKGMRPTDFMLICVDASDIKWREVVDLLQPGFDWSQFEKKHQKPVVGGTLQKEEITFLCEYLTQQDPTLKLKLHQHHDEKKALALVLAGGIVGVHEVDIKRPVVLN